VFLALPLHSAQELTARCRFIHGLRAGRSDEKSGARTGSQAQLEQRFLAVEMGGSGLEGDDGMALNAVQPLISGTPDTAARVDWISATRRMRYGGACAPMPRIS
jgi:hypothetical protein